MSMFKIVTQISGVRRFYDINESLRHLHEAGFDGADMSMFQTNDLWLTETADFCKAAKAASKAHGIPFMQAHAPFPGRKFSDKEYDAKMEPIVKRAIEVAGELEAGIIVVHPIHCPTLSAKEQMEWNIDYYMTLEPLCRKYGIKVAIENMWGHKEGRIVPNVCSTGDELAVYADALPSDCFTVCADIGHFPLVGSKAHEDLKILGARTGALHIHDNDGIHDLHALPYTGVNNWDEICKALANAGFSGNLTFEADNGFTKKFPAPLLDSALRHLAEVGRHLAAKIEEYKQNPSENEPKN